MSANGRLEQSELTFVQGQIQLANITASAWNNFVEAARQHGPVPTITPPYGGYRSYADQQKAHGKGNHQYLPGTSVHGYGTCVDIWNWARIENLDNLAAQYGFRRTIDHEPWHYQHDGETTAPPVPEPEEDDLMPYFIFTTTDTGKSYRVGEFSCFEIPPNTANALLRGGAKQVKGTDSDRRIIGNVARDAITKYERIARAEAAANS